MIIEIDFNSNEALYMQLRNQIIMGIATSQFHEGDSPAECTAAGGYHQDQYAYCK